MWKESFEAFQKCEEIVTHYYKDKQHPDVGYYILIITNNYNRICDAFVMGITIPQYMIYLQCL